MKQNKAIKACGPYCVVSISLDSHGVRLVVYPAFPEYGESWAIRRAEDEGGGPSIFSVVHLANEFERFLNQPYTGEAVENWKMTLQTALNLEAQRGHDS